MQEQFFAQLGVFIFFSTAKRKPHQKAAPAHPCAHGIRASCTSSAAHSAEIPLALV